MSEPDRQHESVRLCRGGRLLRTGRIGFAPRDLSRCGDSHHGRTPDHALGGDGSSRARSLPNHSHPHEQMGMMISGRLEFTVDDTTRVLGPGDIWRIPGGVAHSVRALEEPAVALDVFHPIREDYL